MINFLSGSKSTNGSQGLHILRASMCMVLSKRGIGRGCEYDGTFEGDWEAYRADSIFQGIFNGVGDLWWATDWVQEFMGERVGRKETGVRN